MNFNKITQKTVNKVIQSVNEQAHQVPVIISDKTQEFMTRLSNSQPDVIENFLKCNAQPFRVRIPECKFYSYENLIMAITDGPSAYNLEQNLTNSAVKDLAPGFVGYLQLGKNKFLTVMEFDTESIEPYSNVADRVSSKVKNQFKDKLISMLNSGYVNKEIFANKESLFVTKDCNRILAGDWTDITRVAANEKDNYIKSAKDFLP